MSNDEDKLPGSCIVEDGEGIEPIRSDKDDVYETSLEQPLSKNQLKKLKAQERKGNYLEKRKLKRVEEKQMRKRKREALKEAGQGALLKRIRPKTMAESTSKIRVAIDMSFDHLMTEKDCKRSVLQLNWCYSANRRASQPLQYYVVGFDGKSREIFDSVETNKNQDIHLEKKSLDEVFDPSEVVYLTADSDNILITLDESKVYVIGGIVDHNSQKGLCFHLAEKKGYGHARLPIDEFVEMKTRKVLTINHVFEILVQYSECNDWEKAFFTCMPPRKGMMKKVEDEQAVAEKAIEAE